MVKRKRLILIILPVVFIALFVFFIVSGDKNKVSYQAPLPAIKIQKPVMGEVSESLTLSAYIEAKAMIPVVPFVAGTIMDYDIKAGDYVEKDQVLARIDDAPYRQQLLQAEAALSAYESTYNRISKLYKVGAATQQDYDSVKAQYDAGKAQYDMAKLQMDYTLVKAPVSGTVLVADQAVGSIGTTTSPVAVIADMDNLVVRLKVPEKYFDLFQLRRDSIKMTVTRPGMKDMYGDAVTSASIENIAPYISAESKNFQVVCHLDDVQDRFKPGMYVKVSATYNTHNDVSIMPLTTRKLDGSAYIYNPDTNAVKYIELNNVVQDNSNFIIPEEYSDCWFVTDGQNVVFDGQQVRVVE